MIGPIVTKLPHTINADHVLHTPWGTPSKWVPFIFEIYDLYTYYNIFGRIHSNVLFYF